MALSLGNMGQLGGLATTPSKGVAPIMQRIFADGTDGFYFDFSKTDRLFQETIGPTQTDDANEAIGLALDGHEWAGASLASLTAGATELRAGGVTGAIGTAGASSFNTSTGVGEVTRVDVLNQSYVAFGVVAGGTYAIDIESVSGGSLSVRDSGPGGTVFFPLNAQRVTRWVKVRSAGLYIAASGAATVNFVLHSLKRIPGNHALQATAAAQPKWQAGGFARFDGMDDGLLSILNPAAVLTLGARFKPTSGGRFIFGSQSAPTTRAAIAVAAGGFVQGTFGSSSTLVGSTDIRGQTVTAFAVCDGTNTFLYVDGNLVALEARSGTINTTVPMMLGCTNNAGVAAGFADVDLYHALAIKKALTAAEIAEITDLWGTT